MENEIRQRNINSHSHQITLLNSELFLILSFIFKESSIQDKKFHIFQWNLRTTLDVGPNYLDILLLFDLSGFHSWQYNCPMDYSWYGLALIFLIKYNYSYILNKPTGQCGAWPTTSWWTWRWRTSWCPSLTASPPSSSWETGQIIAFRMGSPDNRQLIKLNIYVHQRNNEYLFFVNVNSH